MLDGYKNTLNAHGIKSLIKNPVIPHHNLAIGEADEKASVPLLIFKEQGKMNTKPVQQFASELPYEKTAVKGANDNVSMENFETTDFDIGVPYDSI